MKRGNVSIALIAAFGAANGQVLWYNGDFDGRTFFPAVLKGSIQDSRVYDDFEISGGPAVTKAVFANLFATPNLLRKPLLYVEFRQQVSEGDGGVLIAGGTLAATARPTGRSFQGLREYQFRAEVSLVLSPGIYWMGVAASALGTGSAFIGTTLGGDLNPGSDPNPPPFGYRRGNSFIDSSTFQLNFARGESATGLDPTDFSMGIEGVPEPTTVAVLGLGLAALVVRRRAQR